MKSLKTFIQPKPQAPMSMYQRVQDQLVIFQGMLTTRGQALEFDRK